MNLNKNSNNINEQPEKDELEWSDQRMCSPRPREHIRKGPSHDAGPGLAKLRAPELLDSETCLKRQ